MRQCASALLTSRIGLSAFTQSLKGAKRPDVHLPPGRQKRHMDRIGKYHILKKLGEGATSVVYLCHDAFTNRDVAVKLVKDEVLKNPETGHMFNKLFIAEASLAGKLTHPHIASIFDSVDTPEQKFIVIEYVPGGTLERFTKPDTLLPPSVVVEIIFKCSRALDFAHRIGVTHRDIKPANILAVMQGKFVQDIKITDFGAAITSNPDQTQVAGVGSPAYMSPEQIQDKPIDQRSDLFSLGIVFYQLLTGHLPFEAGSHAAMLYQICNGNPTPISHYRKGLHARLEQVVMKAMCQQLDNRYQSWNDLSLELAELVSHPEVFATDPNYIAESQRFELLRGLAFFKDFSDVEIWEVVRAGLWERHHPDTLLFEEGEPGENFYVLVEGEMKVLKAGKLLNIVSVGECLGEMAYLASYPHMPVRSAQVRTMGACMTVAFSKDTLGATTQACQYHFDKAFLRILVERLMMANQRLTTIRG